MDRVDEDMTPRDPDRLRVLLITDRAPSRRAGYGIRVSNVVHGLASVGSLTVCLVDSSVEGGDLVTDDHITGVRIRARDLPRALRMLRVLWTFPNSGYRSRKALLRRIEAAVGAESYDVVWFSRARVRQLCGDMFDGVQIVDLDDLDDRLELSLVADRRQQLGLIRTLPRAFAAVLLARRWRKYHHQVARDVDQVIVCTEADQDHLGVANCSIVPNGYPEPEQLPPRPHSDCEPPKMIFVGPLTYEPNYLAVHWLVHRVLDRVRAHVPDVQLIVVGEHDDDLDDLAHPAVTFLGFVDDVAGPYDQADVAVAPVHSGGGTCVKVIEAMARRRPLVTTPFACARLGLRGGEEVIVAESATDFAAACVSMLTDRQRADRLVEQASLAYAHRLNAGVSSRAVADVVRTIVHGSSPHETGHDHERH